MVLCTGQGKILPWLNVVLFSHSLLTRTRGDSSIFVIDSVTSECLHYQSVTGFPSTKLAKIPREILTDHPEVEIRNDLIDCSIDICSVEVCMSTYLSEISLEFRVILGAVPFPRQF